MNGPLNTPANTSKTSGLIYDMDKKLFGEQVSKGTPMNDILCIMDKLFEAAFKGVNIECIDLETLGIKCEDTTKTKQCQVIEYLISGLTTANATMNTLSTVFQQVKSSIGSFNDEKVKITATGKVGYLADHFASNAPDTIKYINDQVIFYGLVPVGFRGSVARNRLGDFDSTGKGKIKTDLWGWAINNGNNGTVSLLGYFPMYTDDINNSNITGGSINFTITAANIKTFAIPVTGTISEALDNDVKFKININAMNKCFGLGSCRKVLVPEPGADATYESDAKNFRHTHAFNLAATHTNPTPTPIDLIPRHIKVIPIERIIV